ncbi:hypothetical protein Pan216_03450 [Planctomycetes bacterium Pan216]|uniref:SPW repeat-containing integral membrane domain-containing protein n=1 Tax=Kolteria novifilia TaxID=2527975 RepID=A0A518AXQ7_9BACT|nr:hypothetical protein Pan216_03450 [Planctomycetes bacterium Pan216]
MWARVVEAMLGCWLAMSPFLFERVESVPSLTLVEFGSALAVILLALGSYWGPTRHAHLGLVVVGAALVAYGRFSHPYPLPAALQSAIMIGLLLMMCAIVPNHASRPPEHWFDEQPSLN